MATSYLIGQEYSLGRPNQQLDGALKDFSDLLTIDGLIDLYDIVEYKELLNDPCTLKGLFKANKLKIPSAEIDLSFSTFIEAANRSFLGIECLEYFTPPVCIKNTKSLYVLQHIVNNICKLKQTDLIWNTVVYNAAKHNLVEILNYLLCTLCINCTYFFDNMAVGAARGGNTNILNFAVTRGIESNTWLKIAYSAAKGGHLNIMELAIENITQLNILNKGLVLNWNFLVGKAAEGCNKNIFRYTLGKVTDWNQVAFGAARGGNISVLKFVEHQTQVLNWNLIAYKAAEGGHVDICMYALNKNIDAWNLIAHGAVRGGNLELLQFICTKEKIKLEDTIGELKDNLEVFSFILDSLETEEYTDWYNLYNKVLTEQGNYDMLDLLEKRFPECIY